MKSGISLKKSQKVLNPSKGHSGRTILSAIAVIVCFIALWPLIGLLGEGFNGLKNGSIGLGVDGPRQIMGTLFLLVFTGLVGALVGTTNGWLLANCRFPGRKLLRIAQLLPLATPAYLLSATLIDLGSIHSIRIYGMNWGILVMALTTYPYVFLLSTESFTKCGRRQLEACRSLGVGPWDSFRRIALPMALPAIGAGVALISMEVINELGAVQLLNIPSISAGIVENWVTNGNPTGAIALAIIGLLIVMILVAYERSLRSRSRRWTEGVAGGEAPCWKLKGLRAMLAQSIAIGPPAFTLGVPIAWIAVNFDQLGRGLDGELLLLTVRSLGLGFAAASLAVLAALLLSVAKRWNTSKWMKSLTFLAGIGYAIPGAVLALSLFPFAGPPWRFAPLILLLWGYSDRFLAVAKGGLDAAFERISPTLDEAAMGLGCKWQKVLKDVHLPLLKGPLGVGGLLVFVDTLKELPLSFTLRPFDFDTLSVRIFQYASDERMPEAIVPSLIILSLGLIASLALIPGLDSSTNIEEERSH
ncbi:iron ABC transporter permease [Prochlorococcus sp. MIT 1307]|uniref:ABC transporter permease n=1 Tax=Prochlorococcus sp. MIT 1307 TaxID=3096219 RepID=UPI002A74BB8E|nr:iron ABC transporter permease [Prochlorococcus sp. MIT 1307]